MLKKRSRGKSKWQQDLGLERIKILFDRADFEFKKHPEHSHRYVQLARKIAMRYNIRMPKSLKRKFCKKCYSYLVPGVNCRVRINKAKQALTITCLECGNIMRYPYRRGET